MILSQKQIEEIAAAVTEDFNKFFFGTDSEEVRMARATPIDQFARDYLGLQVSFARLSSDGSICGLTAYADTEYIVEERLIFSRFSASVAEKQSRRNAWTQFVYKKCSAEVLQFEPGSGIIEARYQVGVSATMK